MGFAAEPYRLRPHVAETTALFASYLFNQFPLRKVCSEVYGFNESALRLNSKLGFREIGRLRDHVWFRDRYWDLAIFELFREDWLKAMERFHFISSIEHTAEAILNGGQNDR